MYHMICVTFVVVWCSSINTDMVTVQLERHCARFMQTGESVASIVGWLRRYFRALYLASETLLRILE